MIKGYLFHCGPQVISQVFFAGIAIDGMKYKEEILCNRWILSFPLVGNYLFIYVLYMSRQMYEV